MYGNRKGTGEKMRNKLFTLLLLSGFLLLAGLAGAEDMAFAAGQAGRPIGELLLPALVGIGAICAGCSVAEYWLFW